MGAKHLTHHNEHLQQYHTRVMKINSMVFLVRKWALAFVQPLLQPHFFSGADSFKWQSAELKMHSCISQDGGSGGPQTLFSVDMTTFHYTNHNPPTAPTWYKFTRCDPKVFRQVL